MRPLPIRKWSLQLVDLNIYSDASMAGVATSEQPSGPTSKKHQDEETQGLEKVTDYVEEKENSAELGQVQLL